MIILTDKQKIGLELAIKKYKNKEKYIIINGFAGSGKSTLVKFIIEALGVDPKNDVAYCAFTGKAAQVLADKGNPNAMTLHKLLYKATATPEGKYIYKKNKSLDYKIIVVDECGMAPIGMINDLLVHKNIYIIFCGDNKQLPPINPEEDNHLLDNPDVFLDEIMRQALDSGIIQLSMKIRNGEAIKNFKSNDAMVLPKSALTTGMLEWADQVLCATNNTRKALNSTIRKLKGYTQPIVEGESLICLHNEWDTCSTSGAPLTNGVIGKLTDWEEKWIYFPKYFKIPNNRIRVIEGRFISDTGEDYGTLMLDKNCIITGEPSLTPQQKYRLSKNKIYKNTIPYEFTYSYVMTTWKAQGSEFGKVLVIEEGFPYIKEEHARWAYTAVTRGMNKVVYIAKE